MTRQRQSGSDTIATADRNTESVRTVNCPQCGGDSVYAPSNPYRPFCGQRCKNIDFGAWADESFRVAQDIPSDGDDTRLQ